MLPVTFKKHMLYWIMPSVVILACILTYFFDFFNLSTIIAHPINREFGVVENLQLIILILIFIIAVKGIKQRTARMEKMIFRVIAIATAVIFFEEIDYGLHYYDYFSMHQQMTTVKLLDYEVRNIHNTGGSVLNVMKMTSYALIVLLFVALPLIPSRLKESSSTLAFFTPSRFIITTAISLLVLNQVALLLDKYYTSTNPALNGNISEFEEIMTYYIVFLYIYELLKKPQALLTFRQFAH